jgi:short-subunit dehydrogenase
MNVNCLSPIAMIKGFMPNFLKNKDGVLIVNVLSLAGLIGTPMRTLYSASKFAMDGFGKALHAEICHKNI